MIKVKKHITIKDKKLPVFLLINVFFFVVLLIVVLLNFFVFTDVKIPDNHRSILLTQTTQNINSLLSLPYEEVASVSTKYSVLYKNGNNRKMFVFAIPIREFDNNQHVLLDNTIYEKNDGTYKTQNVEFNVEFSSNRINLNYTELDFAIVLDNINIKKENDYLNTYGEVKETVKYIGAVSNIDMRCIPTYNGLLMEFDLQNELEKNELMMEIDINNLDYLNDPAGYVQILKEDAQVGVCTQGILVDSNNNIYDNNMVKFNEKNKKHYMTIDISKISSEISYPAKLSLNLDFYCFKMFYDTSVYEATPSTNTILNNVSIFDSINKKHDGLTYLKYNVKSFTPKQSSLVDSFTYNFYVMSVKDSIDIEVYRVNKDWCSWTINWKDKPKYKEKLGEFSISEIGWHKIDLTDYVKKLIDRDYDKLIDNNSVVFKIKDNSKGYAILASADNTYMPPYFEVDYRIE